MEDDSLHNNKIISLHYIFQVLWQFQFWRDGFTLLVDLTMDLP